MSPESTPIGNYTQEPLAEGAEERLVAGRTCRALESQTLRLRGCKGTLASRY
ncbi:MAG: hypothetical protein VXZ84_07330 [Planctomycetota bacterium]|nr:hypothetical protein [Planctomycetota bacterium]